MKHALVIVFLLICTAFRAQVVFEREVLSSFAINGLIGSEQFCTTGGQAACNTQQHDTYFQTEGFEQPTNKGLLRVAYSLYYE
jgi:hypothetical protein